MALRENVKTVDIKVLPSGDMYLHMDYKKDVDILDRVNIASEIMELILVQINEPNPEAVWDFEEIVKREG